MTESQYTYKLRVLRLSMAMFTNDTQLMPVLWKQYRALISVGKDLGYTD
jgi:hypothetical protein